jgi:FkbM family methyltransferase
VYDVATGSTLLSKIPPRFIVPALAMQYRLSEPELGRLAELVPKGKAAVDVGVWWGPWSWWLARRASRVDSFEPNSELVAKLQPVLPRNVTLHHVALSDRSGESTLWIPGGGAGTEGRGSLESAARTDDTWREETVTTRRLDDFDLGDVGFVKVDVEGHEFAVLKGAVNLLTTQRPTVLVEIEEHAHREGQLDAIVAFFGDLSYRATYLSRRRWHPIEDLDRQAVAAMANKVATHGYVVNSLFYAGRYVHNFVFRPV